MASVACNCARRDKPADHQRRELKSAERDPVSRAVRKAEYGWNKEIVQAGGGGNGDTVACQNPPYSAAKTTRTR